MVNTMAVLQVFVAAGLLNVWLLRYNKDTSYRGGSARNLKDEFAAYGLPPWAHYVAGAMKIAAAIALIAGLWISFVSFYASALVAFLMLGALAMHLKIKDPIQKSIPAFLMLIASLAIALGSLPI